MAEPAVTEDSAETKSSQPAGALLPQKSVSTTSTGTSTSDSQMKQAQRPAPSVPGRPALTTTTTTTTTTAPPGGPVQRPLASQRPQPTASLDGVMEGKRDRLAKNGTNSPSWPGSPRLKSPPPNSSRSSSRRNSSEHAQSNTAKRLAPVSAPELAAAMLLPDGGKDLSNGLATSAAHLRVPGRAANPHSPGLETVVEGSVPTTPSIAPKGDPINGSRLDGLEADTKNDQSSASNSIILNSDGKEDAPANRTNHPPKAENDSKSRAPGASRPPSNLARRSFTNLTGSKKTAVEPIRTMTVETEPVNATTTSLGERRDAGSVRTKTSTETIRPKKEKKKPTRKPLLAGGATKADIFEAKVATAVDEADTSDSDETFVYESNPPEPRSYRHHSRTPSATSLASTNDHFRTNKHGIRGGSNAVAAKKSMKFSNSVHAREVEDDPNRSGTRNANSTNRHHHIGRHGRSNHTSLFDHESPFGQQARQPGSPRNATGTFRNSRPNSPRLGNGRVTSPRKYGGTAYDNNEDVADDERAPLMGTVRGTRTRHSKRPHSRGLRSLEMGEEMERGCWNRCTSYALLMFVLIVICSGLGLFAMAVNRPLLDVEIRKITNVLATEQQLMLDLDVKAINPNLFAVMVSDLDVNLFAQSAYVGTSLDWHREHPAPSLRPGFAERRKRSWFWPEPAHPNDGVDEGTDPDDPEGAQKMLLGRVQVFDSPLTFEPAPIRHNAASSVGEIRLAKPGNKTEVGGSDRWERVLQHDFDLIVRGVIKYQLPFSSKMRSAKIAGRKTVHPDGEEKDPEVR